MLKVWKLLPLATLFATNGSGETNPDYDQGNPVKATQMISEYNAPARIDTKNSWDFFLTASFIYWQPKMDGLHLGESSVTQQNIPGHVFNMDFDYKPGFKVGLGLNSHFDHWTAYIEYTWIQAKNKAHHSTPVDVPASVTFWTRSTSYDTLDSEWKHHNNILDFDLGRSYYVGTKLTFFPFIGARAYWINHLFDVSYFRMNSEEHLNAGASASAHSWAFGGRAGLQTNWFMGKKLIGLDFRLIGNVAASLVYQNFNTMFKEFSPRRMSSKSNKDAQMTPNVEGALGLGWGSYFNNSSWHFDLAALYEFHYFWNQNTMRTLANNNSIDVLHHSGSGNLMYQGLTVTARLDF